MPIFSARPEPDPTLAVAVSRDVIAERLAAVSNVNNALAAVKPAAVTFSDTADLLRANSPF